MTILEFIALQRVRVPASRDATEARLAASVKALMLQLHASGELPPAPPELRGGLDAVQVAIDPHQSIHGMVPQLDTAVRHVFDAVGLAAIHNATALPFLTSDNPVIWFDPTVPDEDQRPYVVDEGGPAMLFLPVSPTLLLMGTTEYRSTFAQHGLQYAEAPDEDWVLRVNEAICRYGYEAVYASQSGQESIIASYAHESPVLDPQSGSLIFGKRVKLPKWKRG